MFTEENSQQLRQTRAFVWCMQSQNKFYKPLAMTMPGRFHRRTWTERDVVLNILQAKLLKIGPRLQRTKIILSGQMKWGLRVHDSERKKSCSLFSVWVSVFPCASECLLSRAELQMCSRWETLRCVSELFQVCWPNKKKKKKQHWNGNIKHFSQAIQTKTGEITFMSMHGYGPLAFSALLRKRERACCSNKDFYHERHLCLHSHLCYLTPPPKKRKEKKKKDIIQWAQLSLTTVFVQLAFLCWTFRGRHGSTNKLLRGQIN